MKSRNLFGFNFATLILTLSAQAQLTWDSSSDAGIQIGAGTWDAATSNWTSDGGATNTTWSDGSAAVFDGDLSAQTDVTLSGAISANGISRVGTGAGMLRLVASTGNTLAVSGDVNVETRLQMIGGDAGAFSGSFNKTGTGLLVLDGSNTRFNFGTVTLSAGSIALFNGSPLQSETLVLNGGAIGSWNTTSRSIDGNVTIGGDIGMGSGTGPELNSGTLNFGSTGSVDLGGATRILTIGSAVNFNGMVSNGGLTKAGSGRLTLAGNNNYSATTINGGTLQVGNGGTTGTLGSGAVTISAGTLQISRSDAYTISNDISGTGTFRFEGTGTTTLTGNNSWTGNTRVLGGGVLSVTTVDDAGGIGALGAPGGTLRVAEDSTLRITGNGTQTSSRQIWNSGGAGEDGPSTFDVVDANASVVFTSNGGNINRPLTKTGDGSLTLNQQIYSNAGNTVTVNGGTLQLNGANFYTGATTVNEGTLIIGASLANTPVTVADGATLINNGTIGGTVVTVGSNSILTGTGTYNGAVTVNGQLNPGNSPGFQNFASSLTLGASAITTIEIGGLTRSTLLSSGINHYDAIDVDAAFTLDGTINVTWFGGYEASLGDSFDLFNWGSIDTSNFDLDTDLNLPAFTSPGLSWNTSSFLTNGQINVIPEPAAALLGGIGLMFLLRRRR
jgi:autotransporter-associated beta strand protein